MSLLSVEHRRRDVCRVEFLDRRQCRVAESAADRAMPGRDLTQAGNGVNSG